MRRVFFILQVAVLLLAVACGGDDGVRGPIGPTPTPSQTGSTSGGNNEPPTVTTPAAPPTSSAAVACTDRSSLQALFDDRGGVRIKNSSKTCHADVAVASFSMYDMEPNWSAQELFDIVFTRVEPSSEISVSIELPPCTSQVDALFDVTKAKYEQDKHIVDPPQPTAMLIGFRWYRHTKAELCKRVPPVCTSTLTLAGSYAQGQMSILASAPGAVRTVNLSIVIDGGSPIAMTAQTGPVAATQAYPQDDKEHTVVVNGSFVDENGATCLATTKFTIPKKETPVCTVQLGLTAGYSNGLISILPSAPGVTRPVSMEMVIDASAPVVISGQTNTSTTRPFVQDSQDHVGVVTGSYVGENGATCTATTKFAIPKKPVQLTCQDVAVILTEVLPRPAATISSWGANVRLNYQGTFTSVLLDGLAVPTPANGVVFPKTYPRDGTPKVVTAMVDSTGLKCEAKLTLQPPPSPTCADVDAKISLVGQPVMTPTAVTYTVVPTWKGDLPAAFTRDTIPLPAQSGQSVSPIVLAPGSISVLRLVVDPTALNCRAELKLTAPTCSAINPPDFEVVSSSVVEQNGGVTVNARVRVLNMPNLRAAIYWRNGNQAMIKRPLEMSVACVEGAQEKAFETWTSQVGGHQPSQGGKYSVIRYTETGSGINILEEVPITNVIIR